MNKQEPQETKEANNYQSFDCSHFDQMESLCNDGGELLKGIYAYGFEMPSPIQAKAIPAMADKRDLIAQSQSGTGKTGAFAIGLSTRINSKEEYPQALVISNTRELATQSHQVIFNITKYMNIKVGLCIGGTTGKDVRSNLYESHKSQILVGTPGRIVDLIERDKSNQGKRKLLEGLKILVLDEADVLLKDDFLLQIKEIIMNIPKNTQICIFSATFTQSALNLTKKFMQNPVNILVEQEKVSLDLIKHYQIDVTKEDWKYDILMELYQHINICQAVIFVNSISRADALSDRLTADGHSVGTIHSKLSDVDRLNVLMEFRGTQTRVLVATDLISRGIDVQQVGLVINYDIPSDAEQYIHRVGRSGRYGKSGVAINFVTRSRMDKEKIKNIETEYHVKIDDMPELNEVNCYLTGSSKFNPLVMS